MSVARSAKLPNSLKLRYLCYLLFNLLLTFCKRSSINAVSFQIAGLLHGALSGGLAVFEGLLDRHLTGQCPGNILAYYRADGLKLRDTYKLDARVGHRLDARVVRVGRLHGL